MRPSRPTHPNPSGGRLSRRTLLRASAAGAVALALPRPAVRLAAAQSAAPRIADWVEAERVGVPLYQPDGTANPAPTEFQADLPFFAVAPHWSGKAAPGAYVVARFSRDGGTWSNPYTIGEDPDGGRPGTDHRRFGRLCGVPGGASFVRYQTYDANDVPTVLPGFTWTTIDASEGPSALALGQRDGDLSVDAPPIVWRPDWGCDESLRFDRDGREIWPQTWATVEHVVVHHSDTMNFEDPSEAIRSIYAYHAITKGWGDIGYNYVVDFLGNVYEGRFGGENVVGGHAYGYNDGTCGICLMGRYGDEQITPEMRAGLTWIVAWAARNLDPTGSADFKDIPSLPTIVAHRDVNPTTCPGDVLYDDLARLRQDVAAILAGRQQAGLPPAEFVAGQAVVTVSDGGMLREGPGTEFTVITPVPTGEALVVAEGPTTNDGYAWYAVQGASLAGWIVADVLAPDTAAGGEAADPPAEGRPDKGDGKGNDGKGDGNGGKDDGKNGGRGNGNGGGNDKNRQGVGGEGGTVDLANWAPPPLIAIGATAEVADGPLNLRTDASREAGVVTTLDAGQVVTVVDGPADAAGDLWYLVQAEDGATGWCNAAYLTPH